METDKILALNEKCKKLNSDELIDLIYRLKLANSHPDLIKIMKTYLFRNLMAEGVR